MLTELLVAAGGLGLFLVGMTVMTDGLRSLAGAALNRIILRFTRSPASGALTGALVTAVVQSSSAVTVATVGFVSAGLMQFSQALGLVFGANIGTTITGWMVALLGFKLELDPVLWPLLLAGALLRLLSNRRAGHLGWAAAGFALVLLGIGQLQAGLGPLSATVTPDTFPDDTLVGRLLLVGAGALLTLITQSSSAGVALALTALHAGAVSFPQAAALVIGMDVGTTSTTSLAAIGASPRSRRTALSHVIYNLMTGVGAFLLLTPYARLVERLWPQAIEASGELVLVGFHTTFNTLGVLAVLPFTAAFGRLMERLVPERGPRLGARLDPALLLDSSAADAALWSTVSDLSGTSLSELATLLQGAPPGDSERSSEVLDELRQALVAARDYADRAPSPVPGGPPSQRHVDALHVADHVDRLEDRCRQRERAETVRSDAGLAPDGARLADAVAALLRWLKGQDEPLSLQALNALGADLRQANETLRERGYGRADGKEPLEQTVARLDAARWLARCTEHVTRMADHLQRGEVGAR